MPWLGGIWARELRVIGQAAIRSATEVCTVYFFLHNNRSGVKEWKSMWLCKGGTWFSHPPLYVYANESAHMCEINNIYRTYWFMVIINGSNKKILFVLFQLDTLQAYENIVELWVINVGEAISWSQYYWSANILTELPGRN